MKGFCPTVDCKVWFDWIVRNERHLDKERRGFCPELSSKVLLNRHNNINRYVKGASNHRNKWKIFLHYSWSGKIFWSSHRTFNQLLFTTIRFHNTDWTTAPCKKINCISYSILYDLQQFQQRYPINLQTIEVLHNLQK